MSRADTGTGRGLPVSYADVVDAARRLRGQAHRTQVVTSRTVDARTRAQVFFKCENLQRGGAFKFRGAYNALLQLTTEQKGHGVVAYSSGNHAQAVALAGQLLQVPAVIVMPADAPPVKIEATRGYGAEVVLYDRSRDDREAIAAALATTRGLTPIPPFDRAIGVEPAAGDDVTRSFRTGTIQRVDNPDTIADGARTSAPGAVTFPLIMHYVADMLTVDDEELLRTVRYLWERLKLVVEPTGALGAAALLEGKIDARGQRVGVVLSGGNADLKHLCQLF